MLNIILIVRGYTKGTNIIFKELVEIFCDLISASCMKPQKYAEINTVRNNLL